MSKTEWPRYGRTRFPELGYTKVTPTLWRIIAIETEAVVGPQYRTKTELLADLDRYAKEYGVA